MKNLVFLFILSVFFVACGGGVVDFKREKWQFQELVIDEKKYYFRYPSEALIDLTKGELSYKDCLVNFERNSNFDDKFVGLEKEENRSEKIIYNSFYKDGRMMAYAGIVNDIGFYSFVSADQIGQSCVKLVEDLTESFTDQLLYVNERLGLSVRLPPDFKVEYLPGEEGVVLKKWIEKKVEVGEVERGPSDEDEIIIDVFEPYRLEIGAAVEQNFDEFQNIADFVGYKYPGYSIEFQDFGKFSGYYVNETVALEAISHFFVMGEGGAVIYDFYLRVPGKRYNDHKKEFEEFVNGVQLN